MRARAVAVIAAVTAGVACVSTLERTVTTAELRAAVVQLDLGRMHPRSRAAVERGEVWRGATEAEAFVARGEPRLWWNTRIAGRACRVLVHAGADGARADTAVTTCGGVVVAVAPIAPALPCWRLAAVGPRIVAAARYFDGLALERQWQIVAGILHRGQTERDVAIAFGEPYSRGFDEREDGVRADQHVFLDHGGDAYGLAVTFIRGAVAGWRMPAERRLTPEAEQRRLDAMERRLTDKLAALEAQSRRQHAETVALFNDVMTRQDAMLATLTRPPEPAPGSGDAAPPGPSGPPPSDDPPLGPGVGSRPDRRPPPGVTIERRRYTAADLPWGKRCTRADDCRVDGFDVGGNCWDFEGTTGRICTRSMCTTNADCAGGFTCRFELKQVGMRFVESGMKMCRP